MKDKLNYLIKTSLKKKFSSKWFIVVNIILFFSIAIVCNIDNIVKSFGGDFLQPTKIYVVDDCKTVYPTFNKIFNETNKITLEQSEIKLINSNKKVKELSNEIKEEKEKDIIIHIKKDNKNLFSANIISYDNIDTFLYQNIVNSLNSTKSSIAFNNSDIEKDKLYSIYKEIDIKKTYLDTNKRKDSQFIETISNFIIPIFILPFFFLIILLVQMIGAEINDEKSSRSMEIIISSVSPRIHFISKIIANNVFVITQGLLFVFYFIIGYLFRKLFSSSDISMLIGVDVNNIIEELINSQIINELLIALPLILILFICSFIAYSLIAGILASVTTNIEDFSQIQTPLMIILVIGYYLAIVASMYDNSLLIKICSFIPLLSTIISPVLLILGQIGVFEVIISILLIVLLDFLLIKYGLRVYKVGILNYSSNNLWKKMFKALKLKD